jgi:HD-GYP domain-containing protein (c-di-GMP phosphodiesterase class II)
VSLAVRTFACSFIPLMLLLVGSFWAVERAVVATVRNGLRSSLREHQASVGRMRLNKQRQNSRSLRALSENPALKAGLRLILQDRTSKDARLTVEDQLRELCETVGVDSLVISDLDGAVLAGVMRHGTELAAVDSARMTTARDGMLWSDGTAYQVTSLPVDEAEENMAVLSVGEQFNFAEFETPVVLTFQGKTLKSSLPGVTAAEIEPALRGCGGQPECEVKIRGQAYVSLAQSAPFGNGYQLHSLLNLDAAVNPVQSVLKTVFLMSGAGVLFGAVFLTAWSSRSVAGPIASIVAHLQESEATGILPHFDSRPGQVRELRKLTDSFNSAALAIREGRESLVLAYLEFVQSLASALDARDCYTAGHSQRVSDYACDVARTMGFKPAELDNLRIGALLHDIGKIGVPDSVLQKPGRLTPEEHQLIQMHPGIGREILEGVHGFAPYLSTVELHHENWDGTGYPHGLGGYDVPLPARIVHIVDAYDAMTSNRPYRPGMTTEQAVRILEQNSGTQFDPEIVPVFVRLAAAAELTGQRDRPELSLANLAAAVAQESRPVSIIASVSV